MTPAKTVVKKTRSYALVAQERLLRYSVGMTAHAKSIDRILRGTSDKNIEFESGSFNGGVHLLFAVNDAEPVLSGQ